MTAPIAQRQIWLAADPARVPFTDAELAELEAIDLAEQEARVADMANFLNHAVFPVLLWLAGIGAAIVALAQLARWVMP